MCASPTAPLSKLYTETPAVSGLKSLAVNGKPVTPHIVKGYAVITREWEAGDRIELELPMEAQRVMADPRIKADANLWPCAMARWSTTWKLRISTASSSSSSDDPLKAEWRPDLLGGVMVITGKWKDGTPMLAIPNYARMNRVAHELARSRGQFGKLRARSDDQQQHRRAASKCRDILSSGACRSSTSLSAQG